MAALNFPASPSVDDLYTANGSTWKWDGTSWNVVPANVLLANLGDVSVGGVTDGQALVYNSTSSDWEAGTVLTNVSDIETQVKTATNATGSAPVYSCRAWVNFNGTGTVAIRDIGNVSSITDNGTGDYNVNFTTAMPDVNYSISGLSGLTVTPNQTGMYPFLGTTTSFRIVIYSTTGTLYDEVYIAAQVFR
jgi:hypothetical protein